METAIYQLPLESQQDADSVLQQDRLSQAGRLSITAEGKQMLSLC